MKQFTDSRFWRTLSIAFVASLFWLGFNIGAAKDVHLVPTVQADGVSIGSVSREYVTTSADGEMLHYWTDVGENEIRRVTYRVNEGRLEVTVVAR
jgi:hypothetical protein